MNFKTHNTENINLGGTCLQGEIEITYSILLEIFGEPHSSDGYKSDAEWEIEWSDNKVATIYNWKDGYNYNGSNGDGMATEDITDWHIGGKDPGVVKRIERIIAKYEKENNSRSNKRLESSKTA